MNAVTSKLPQARLTYLGNASASSKMEEFTGAQAGQSVCYWLRCVNTRGEKARLWGRSMAKAHGANPSPPPSSDKLKRIRTMSMNCSKPMPHDGHSAISKINSHPFCGGNYYLLICLLLIGLMTGAARAEDGLQILKQWEATLRSITFSAKCDWGDGNTVTVVQRPTDAGVFEVKKTVVAEVQGIKDSGEFISNGDGLWEILPHSVLRLDYLQVNNKSPFWGIFENSLDMTSEAEYDVKKIKKEGLDLFEVVQRFRPSTIKSSLRHGQIKEAKILIGCTNYFIYAYSNTREDGTTANLTITDFTKLDSIADDYFKLPLGVNQVICTNSLQYGKAKVVEINERFNDPKYLKTLKGAFIKQEKRSSLMRYLIVSIMIIPSILFAGIYIVRRHNK